VAGRSVAALRSPAARVAWQSTCLTPPLRSIDASTTNPVPSALPHFCCALTTAGPNREPSVHDHRGRCTRGAARLLRMRHLRAQEEALLISQGPAKGGRIIGCSRARELRTREHLAVPVARTAALNPSRLAISTTPFRQHHSAQTPSPPTTHSHPFPRQTQPSVCASARTILTSNKLAYASMSCRRANFESH
jgi:hypothetical protein